MKKCPFCGEKVIFSHPFLLQLSNGRWLLNHYCHLDSDELDVVIDIYGDTKEEVIQKWNRVYEKSKSESL